MAKRKRQSYQRLVGKKFGRLTVIEIAGVSESGHTLVLYRCECGEQRVAQAQGVARGETKSCGCLRRDRIKAQGLKNIIDLKGRKFGLLKVFRRDRSEDFAKPRWVCKCECGNTKSIQGSNLRNGTVRSCGCLIRRRGKENPAWKGGRSMKEGYVMVGLWEGGKKRIVPEHRLVMEKHLGRKLTRNENVHHKNGDKADNRLKNLELWVKTQPCGQRVKDIIRFCVSFLRKYAPDKLA